MIVISLAPNEMIPTNAQLTIVFSDKSFFALTFLYPKFDKLKLHSFPGNVGNLVSGEGIHYHLKLVLLL